MELISHRANLFGPDETQENHPEQILKCVSLGFNVEIDLWINEQGLYLGHDSAQYKIELDFLLNLRSFLYVHIKSSTKVSDLYEMRNINWFFHEDERFVYTNLKDKWYYPSASIMTDGINLMPETTMGLGDFSSLANQKTRVCSDFVGQLKGIQK